MKITEVQISYAQTYNLGNYSNVKPEARLTANLSDGDDPEIVRRELQAQAEAHAHEVIDAALEAQGDSPHFWNGPRYDLVEADKDKLLVIIPSDYHDEMPDDWPDLPQRQYGWRFETLWKYANEQKGYTVLDCHDGDFSDLPRVVKAVAITCKSESRTSDKYLLLIRQDDQDKLPDSWRAYWLNKFYVTRKFVSLRKWAEDQAIEQELILIDCLDGDLSRIPDLRLIEEEATIEEEIPFEEDEDYEEEEDE